MVPLVHYRPLPLHGLPRVLGPRGAPWYTDRSRSAGGPERDGQNERCGMVGAEPKARGARGGGGRS